MGTTTREACELSTKSWVWVATEVCGGDFQCVELGDGSTACERLGEEACTADDECVDGTCIGDTCVPFHCFDETLSGNETGVDCGGSCKDRCPDGAYCDIGSDCAGGCCNDDFYCEADADGDDTCDSTDTCPGQDDSLFVPGSCTECANATFTGSDCSECFPHFAGPDCAQCAPGFTGDTCRACSDPVSPLPQGAPISLDLDSGVVAVVVDFGYFIPGVNLRLYFDIQVDEASGDVVMVATNGGLASPDVPANTVDPDDLVPLYGPAGWTVSFTGLVYYDKDCGEVYLETDTTDLHITVSEVFIVHLNGVVLKATIRPGEGLDGRIHFDGYMHIEEGFWGIDANDLAALGMGSAAWEGNALREDEVPVKLPRVCSEDPCAVHTDGGGDCQLPSPWIQPASCP